MCKLLKTAVDFFQRIGRYLHRKFKGNKIKPKDCAFWGKNAQIAESVLIYSPKNFYIGDNSYIGFNSIIMNTRAKFILGRNSGTSFGLTIITGNHLLLPGYTYVDISDKIKDKFDIEHKCDQDIIVDDDVWIGCNVTILKGVHVGRGAVIGAGSVIRRDIPPYGVVCGNPAKLIKFKFSIEEIIKHEKRLYTQGERISESILYDNYKKYYLDRINEIQNYVSL